MRYTHAEAFCLMKYVSSDGKKIEWIWNSRDGVTPFIIIVDGVEMAHTDFHLDRPLPNYKPEIGEHVFVDMPPKRAYERLALRVETFWDREQSPLSALFETKMEAIEALFKSDYRPGSPEMITGEEYYRREEKA